MIFSRSDWVWNLGFCLFLYPVVTIPEKQFEVDTILLFAIIPTFIFLFLKGALWHILKDKNHYFFLNFGDEGFCDIPWSIIKDALEFFSEITALERKKH